MDNHEALERRQGRWVKLFVAIVLATCCCAITFTLYSGVQLVIHQMLWRVMKPTEYCMEVHELQVSSGTWEWAVHVRNDHTVQAQLAKVDLDREAAESFFNPDNLTIEQIFALASRHCARHNSFFFCGIEFDSYFHYPKQVFFSDLFVIEVEQFAPYRGTEGCIWSGKGP